MSLVGLGSKIFGNIKSGQAMDKNRRLITNRIDENQTWFDTAYNRDFLGTNVASSALSNMLEQITARDKDATAAAEATGASDAATVAAKGQNQLAMSALMRSLSAMGTARKDRVENIYQNTLNQLTGRLGATYRTDAQSAANLANTGGQLLEAAAPMFGDYFSQDVTKKDVDGADTEE
jgi:hypothetical protein